MTDAEQTLAALAASIDQAADAGADLLVLPECAYPAYLLGSIDSYREADHLSSDAFVDWLKARAKATGLHIISGLVEASEPLLGNAAVFIDPTGNEIGRARKRFLWHADHQWYQPGEEIRTFDSELGRIAIVICAETRVPEILATVAADGAQLVAMPTCWINGASTPGEFENPQVEFLIESRAREFGLPFACADKSGLELATGYVGQSRIVRADGSLAAEAPATGETTISAEVTLSSPKLAVMSDSHRQRLLSSDQPYCLVQSASSAGSEATIEVAVLSGELTQQWASDEHCADHLRRLALGQPAVLLLATCDPSVLAVFERAALPLGIQVLSAHDVAEPVQIADARIGCIHQDCPDGFAAARCLALAGADIIWIADVHMDQATLRTRAAENRVFVVAADWQAATIIDPNGCVIEVSEPGVANPALSALQLARARDKEVAPQTNIFAQRQVASYRF
jgi:predicted amidohydrolase